MTLNIQTLPNNKWLKTIPATELKNKVGSVINWTIKNQDDLVVESRGVPKVVIMPYSSYQEILKFRQEARRKAALAQWQQLRKDIQTRNPDLTDEKAEAFANEFSQEVKKVVLDKRKQKYG